MTKFNLGKARSLVLFAVCALAIAAACSSGAVQDLVGVPPSVASVAVSPPSRTATVGETFAMSVILRDASGGLLSGRTVAWSSSNQAVATVSSAGMVTAVSAGAVTITASSEGQSGTASVIVAALPTVPVAVVTVSLGSSSVTVGSSTQATAVMRDANGAALTGRAVTWASSNPAVATITTSGQVTAVSVGSTTITGTSEGQVGSANISVVAAPPVPVASVSVSLASASLTVGNTLQATATTRDASGAILTGRTVTWSSGNQTVATVNPAGVVTAIAAGSATITATSEGQSGTATVNVTVPQPAPVASVTVTLGTSSLTVGATTQAAAITRDANGAVLTGRSIAWTSSNSAVASVNASGVVTAVSVGSATITASSEGQSGVSAINMVVTAPVPVATVAVSMATSSLTAGGTTQATAITRDASGNVLNGRLITWSSSNQAVATVTAGGLVTALSAGTATITATSEGQNGTASLTVLAPTPTVASLDLTPSAASLTFGQQVTLSATPRDAQGNALNGIPVTWSSGTSAVATVSLAGVVTAISRGSSVITAAAGGKSATSTITVTPDTTPPALKSLSLTPLTADVTSAGATFTVTLRATDAESGVSGISVSYVGPLASSPILYVGATRTSGTAQDGTWTAQFTVPAGAAPGTWSLNYIDMYDAKGNRNPVHASTMGVPWQFTVQGPAVDTTPPALKSLSLTPLTADVTSAGATFTVTLRATDAESGVSGISVSYVGPLASSPILYVGATRTSGTAQDGTWTAQFTVPAGAAPGTWSLNYVDMYDAKGNRNPVHASTMGVPWQFTIK